MALTSLVLAGMSILGFGEKVPIMMTEQIIDRVVKKVANRISIELPVYAAM